MKHRFFSNPVRPFLFALFLAAGPLAAQEKSVRPGINKQFENPNVAEFITRFEHEGRDSFDHRQQIIEACGIRPGMAVADIGAGTGLFARMFSPLVGPQGRVYAVDISEKFVKHVEATAKQNGLTNIVGVVCQPDSVSLPPDSIEMAFICDTYHHFEFPNKTMRSLHRALRPGGQIILIDFHRIEGKSSDWVLNHVRAGQELVSREIVDSGFRQIEERKDLLKESYFVRFGKVVNQERRPAVDNAEASIKEEFPVLRGQGMPTLVPITEDAVTRPFPYQWFFVARFRQYPVGRKAPTPLKVNNVFAVTKDGKVRHLTDTKGLEDFFRTMHSPVTNAESAKDAVRAWLRLSEEFKQDGFFKFFVPQDSLVVQESKAGWTASGRVVVTRGGKGDIAADLTFTGDGKLATVQETVTVKSGIRPICQATKLLDSDAIVRQMAEKDIVVMGRAAKEYLDEQRAKASPELKQAIDRIWQRIVREGW